MTLALVPVTKALTKAPFSCGYAELDSYFRLYAFKNDRLSIGKTFVALTDAREVAGYVTVSAAQIEVDSLPEDIKAKLPRYPVPAFRIGKLAVDLRFQGAGVGRWLLTEALKRAIEVSREIGLFAVLVDAIDEKAKGFYLKYGFIPFEGHPLTLVLPLATVTSAMK